MCTTVNIKQNLWPQWTKWHDDLRRIQDAKIQTCLNDKLYVQFPTSYFKISNNVPRCRQRRLIAWICIVDFPSVSLNTIKRSQSADEIAFTEYKLCTSCWQTRGNSRSVHDYLLLPFSMLRKLPVQCGSCVRKTEARLKIVFQLNPMKNNGVRVSTSV